MRETMEKKTISKIVFVLEILLIIVIAVIIYHEAVYRLKYGWPKQQQVIVPAGWQLPGHAAELPSNCNGNFVMGC